MLYSFKILIFYNIFAINLFALQECDFGDSVESKLGRNESNGNF